MNYIFIANRRSDDPEDAGVYVINDGSESVNNFRNAKMANEAAKAAGDAYACIITQMRMNLAARVIMNELGEEME
jgi:hypothetical protein